MRNENMENTKDKVIDSNKKEFAGDEFQKQIEELQKRADDNLNLAKYHKAELENYKKHNAGAISNAFKDGTSYVVEMLLPIYDGVNEAEKAIQNEVDKKGFQIIKNKLDDCFKRLNITEIKAVGEPFDPNLHNAVATTEKGETILEEWQKGFLYQGKVLRPSMVKLD
ncbi:MAG: nucleotide exchange factor GrpE [Christensenellaceae bacterium]|nr:nucleotide exchange factor GrpE [Christensenellaceae bacterium]